MRKAYLSTYKFYDFKGRRLAIFAVPTSKKIEGEETTIDGIQIFVETCSKSDSFNKRWVRDQFDRLLSNLDPDSEIKFPLSITPTNRFLACQDQSKLQAAFMAFCNETYYKLDSAAIQFSDGMFLTFNVLVKSAGTAREHSIPVKSTAKFRKQPYINKLKAVPIAEGRV